MTKMYRAILFSPDGEDFVTDYPRETVDEVWDALADSGSRWYFYPICAVIRDGAVIGKSKRIVDGCGCDTHGPEGYYFDTSQYVGRTVGTVMAALADTASPKRGGRRRQTRHNPS